MGVSGNHGSMLTNHLKIFVFAGIAWAIWRSRNKMAIEQCFPSNPLNVFRSGVAFVQKWQPLLGGADQVVIASLGEKLMTWLHNFSPSSATVSDIVEL